MASVFLYHVVGDLTVGKPEMVEFYDTETVETAIQIIGDATERGIPVWKKRLNTNMIENNELRQQRFVGILNSLDVVAFLSRMECLDDQEKAMKTPVSELVVPDNSLLRQVDPGTRLIDALEMMKHGVRRLLVHKSVVWRGMSKRFSILYNGKWLKNIDGSSNNLPPNTNRSSSSSAPAARDKFCCLSREDVIRFIIGCLGALAPLPLSSISVLGAINPNYHFVEASSPAIEVARNIPRDPSAVAVVEKTFDSQYKIIGEISACKLWKCNYLATSWALANLSAGQFVMGVEDNTMAATSLPDFSTASTGRTITSAKSGSLTKMKKFSSRSIGFSPSSRGFGVGRNMYRGRSTPLTCKVSSSLAAVMAQMLSHRATHVWVTETESDEDIVVGVVGYADILHAVTKQPVNFIPPNRSTDGFGHEA